PEDNLPASLVRNYLKQDKRRRQAAARVKPGSEKKPAPLPKTTKPRPLPKPKLMTGKQYRSVSDAFTGGDEVEDLGWPSSYGDSTPSGREPSRMEGGDGADEELLVVEEGAD